MHVSFDPPLREVTALDVLQVQEAERGLVALTFFATLTEEDYRVLNDQGAQIQVWTNLPLDSRPAFEWGANPFALLKDPIHEENLDAGEDKSAIKLCAIAPPTQNSSSDVVLEAQFFIPPALLDAGSVSFQYTYRFVYSNGEIWWQGNGEASNGTIHLCTRFLSVMEGLNGCWKESGAGAVVRTLNGDDSNLDEDPLSLGVLSPSLSWSGWTISEDR